MYGHQALRCGSNVSELLMPLTNVMTKTKTMTMKMTMTKHSRTFLSSYFINGCRAPQGSNLSDLAQYLTSPFADHWIKFDTCHIITVSN